jgi:acyl carrier protein
MLDIKILNDAILAAGITLDVAVSENLDATFAELGLDSLDMFNLFL